MKKVLCRIWFLWLGGVNFAIRTFLKCSMFEKTIRPKKFKNKKTKHFFKKNNFLLFFVLSFHNFCENPIKIGPLPSSTLNPICKTPKVLYTRFWQVSFSNTYFGARVILSQVNGRNFVTNSHRSHVSSDFLSISGNFWNSGQDSYF